MDPVSLVGMLGAGISSNIGNGLNFLGGLLTNSANSKENRRNRRLALKMFNAQMDESYQRTVADMKKAGINPMLAIGNGANSASSHVPSSIPMHNPVPDLANAMHSAASVSKLFAESDLLDAQTVAVLNDIDVKNADLQIRESQLGNEIARLNIERNRLGNETVKTDSEKKLRDAQIQEINSNLKTAEKQRALISAQIERTSSGVSRERYGNKVGPAIELGKHLADLLFDQPTSAMSSENRKKFIKDKTARVIQLMRTGDKSTSAIGVMPFGVRYRMSPEEFKKELQRERRFYHRKRNPRGDLHQSDFR